jgi:thymidylate kinase
MYINFIGSPCSGKTTSAAKLFAELKEMGLEVEFISEYARLYIAKKRIANNFNKIDLTDIDQYEIFEKQFELERTMHKAGGTDAIIISDSSVWNSCLYMTEKGLDLHSVPYPGTYHTEACKRFYTEKNITVISAPVERPFTPDSNRIHSKEESLKINDSIRKIMDNLLPNNKIPVLRGSIDERHRTLMKLVFEKIY